MTGLEVAHDEHYHGLVRYVRSLTRDDAVAEDLAQEAFLRLLVEIRQGRAPGNTPAWLYRVGTNLATSRGRHASVERRHAEQIARPSASDEPEAVALDNEVSAIFTRALGRLRPTDQEAILLATQGYPGLEIAARMGRSHLAARALLCRARSRMREALVTEGFMATSEDEALGRRRHRVAMSRPL